jgi:serine/threonine protein phosphatase 1
MTTHVVGDIHGERALLARLLAELPFIGPDDTLVFLGDYVDRGPHSREVVELLRRLPEQTAGAVVCLRGNHEDALLGAIDRSDPSFLLPAGNGVGATYRSFLDAPDVDPLSPEHLARYFDPATWLPASVIAWMRCLPLWHRDPHAIYVHAGLEGEGAVWSPPEQSSPTSLLWQREPDFFAEYGGPPLVFGHTPTAELPPPDVARTAPWVRGPLIGLDTGAGKGGPLTCLTLPARTYVQYFPDGAVARATL